jgi:arylsulfatase A
MTIVPTVAAVLALIGIGPLAAPPLPRPAAESSNERPNMVVILCDDLGYGDLGCYGNPTIRSPHLDRLARQGIRFTSCYAAAPVCSPSRAAMHLPREEITVATLLQRGGYDTCHVGKWHCNGSLSAADQPQPGDHGFAHWFSTQNNAAPSHENPENFVRNGAQVGPLEGYSCQLVADEAIGWLRGRADAATPFFLFVCFHEPHEPVASPPALEALYPDATEKGEAAYYANVTNMDAAVGRLLDTLDELRLAGSTLVFFTSDNGPETLNRYAGAWRSHGTAGPLRGMKLHLREGGIRVPGILRWPGRAPAGVVVDEPISGVDVLPTLCALAGLPPPDDRPLDGTSFVPVLDDRPLVRAVPLFWSYCRALGGPKAAMRAGDLKLVGGWDVAPGRIRRAFDAESVGAIGAANLGPFELHDLREDIGEQVDLATTRPEDLEALKRLLQDRYRDVHAQPRAWPTRP